MNTGIVNNITGWLKQPFNSSGSALDWWLWIGLILVAVYFWTRVLAEIDEIG